MRSIRRECQRKLCGSAPAVPDAMARRSRAASASRAHWPRHDATEWRLDPSSADRLPAVAGYDQRIVVICSEGYASSLAAASLQDLGLVHATDIIGGFRAWAAAGLPVRQRIDPAP